MYLRREYGSGWSLNEAGKLIVNRIKDIRYVGKRSIYKVEVEGGMCISVTDNR